jgi:lipid-binding SYLF domain-containing protein
MRRIVHFCACLALVSVAGTVPAAAQRKETNRIWEAAVAMPDGVPRNLLDRAECVLVFPSVKKFAVGVGGSYGRGVITCRSGEAFDGPWGAPAMMALEGGSFGLQLGGQATDLVLLVMNDRGASSVLGSRVKLGADASAAAGPKGRTAGAATDPALRAEILTYSRSRGLFAGISLEGSSLRGDNDANERIYGREWSPQEIVSGSHEMPARAKPLIDLLNSRSPTNLSNRPETE